MNRIVFSIRSLAGLCVILVLLAPGSGCRPGDSTGGGVKVIKFSHVGSTEEDVRQKSALKFKELVEEYSGGSVTVEVYGGGQLGGDRDAIEGVKFGTIEMTVAGIGIYANFEPRMGISSLPCLFESFEQAWAFTDSRINANLSAPLLKQGIRVLAYWGNGFRCLTNSKRPVAAIEDLRGLTIRTPENPIIMATMAALGANPSPLPWPEVYMALQQKAYDGQENPLHIIYIHKLDEVQKYLTITNHIYESMPVVINEKFWNGLSLEQKEAVKSAIEEVKVYNRNLIFTQTEQMLTELEARGMIVSRIEMGLLRAATEEVRADFGSKHGQELLQQVYRFIQ